MYVTPTHIQVLYNTHLEMHEKRAQCLRMSNLQHMQRVYVCKHRIDYISINEYIFYNKKFAERRARILRAPVARAPTDGAHEEFAQQRTYTNTHMFSRNCRSFAGVRQICV